MSNSRFGKGGTSSSLTEYRRDRMIYANFLIQQQNQNAGAKLNILLDSGQVAPESVLTNIKLGTVFTTAEERDAILQASASIPSAPTILSIVPGNSKLIVVLAAQPYVSSYAYSIDGGATFTNAFTNTTPLVISGLTNSTTYSVVVRAGNQAGLSQNSNLVTGTPSVTTVTFTTVETTTWIAPDGVTTVEYLVVAGGGGSGGGYDTGAGGGGGGGMVLTGTLSVTPGTSYTVTVGDGGTAGTVNRLVPTETSGGAGENSVFASVTSLGGSGGFGSRLPSGGNNGSGGAAAINPSTASGGGRGGGSVGGGGGGGGSSGAGTNKSGTTAGEGGAGTANSLSGSSINYGVGGNGGTGGTTNAAVAGTANRGNGARGGGGASGAQSQGAKGGSGIVIIQY